MKENCEDQWVSPSVGYIDQSLDGLSIESSEVWSKLILSKLADQMPLEILDVGTGSGFFTTILSLAGHDVTGIDLSRDAINLARCNAATAGVFPRFTVMDGQKTTFADHSFDAVISRNVVWALTQPEQAYEEWYRILKPGGHVLVFDADWLVDCRDAEIRQWELEDRQEFVSTFGLPPRTFDEYIHGVDYRITLPLVHESRPEWDMTALEAAGFSKIESCYISSEVYKYESLILARSMPMFMIHGEK